MKKRQSRYPVIFARLAALLVLATGVAVAQDNGMVGDPPAQPQQQAQPAAPPPPPPSQNARIPAGTRIIVRLASEINSATAQSGQQWAGTLVNDIRNGDTVVAPQGSAVTGVITQAKSSGRLGGAAVLSLQVSSVNSIPVASDVLTRDGAGHTKSNVAKIGGGAAAGAILGGLFGGGKGAAIGTVVGAGAGTAGAAASGKKEAVLVAETALTFTAQ